MKAESDSKLVPGYEPIPGYRIQRLLGTGGFGEVWLAEAPGGLSKAIKFVYGSLDDVRAKRELKSLERIKAVHHPFLLTLERFEIVQGQLVIITELADGSLEDVYRNHREQGAAGIPRETLLNYLRDAADALDYLNTRFQLQHLDVKPANFLMVGGHVKLGDFGLVKNLAEIEHTIIGGLTPLYAAPEVFDGRPGSQSDQYSLAIMYQELLTGNRPFEGRTLAQLATQHVHIAPNLDSLPPADRPLVARALEKNPERRFRSCLEFIDALREARLNPAEDKQKSPRKLTSSSLADGIPLTVLTGGNVEDLPQIDLQAARGEDRLSGILHGSDKPQLMVIGLGGLGADCLLAIQEKVAIDERRGGSSLGLHEVLIDTDAETVDRARLIAQAREGAFSTAIHTPLRSPHEYREEEGARLHSVSRRWLYNIPRSQKTEGLRPLGRLAMVDHAEAIEQGLRQAMEKLAEQSRDQAPRVFVVASAGGGTGSGMIWDICHLARHLLDQCGLPAATVIPLLVVPAEQQVGRTPLAVADAFATLVELDHYLQPGNSYPGDAGAGWPSVPAARSPLLLTYLISSPSMLSGGSGAIEMIADYVYADTVGAGPILAAARRVDPVGNQQPLQIASMIRSMGLLNLENALGVDLSRLAMSSSIRVLRKLLGRASEARQGGSALAETWSRELGINARELVEEAWEPYPSDEARRWSMLYRVAKEQLSGEFSVAQLDSILEHFRSTLEESKAARAAYCETVFRRVIADIQDRLRDGRAEWVVVVDALAQLGEALSSVSEMHQLAGPRREGEAREIARMMKSGGRTYRTEELLGSGAEPGPVLRYLELRLSAIRDARLVARMIDLGARFSKLATRLRHRGKVVEGTLRKLQGSLSKANDGHGDPWRGLGAELSGARERIEATVFQGNLLALFCQPSLDSEFVRSIDEVAKLVQDFFLPLLREQTALPAEKVPLAESPERLKNAVAGIAPWYLVCGGYQRRLLIATSDEEQSRFAAKLDAACDVPYSSVVIPGAKPALVHEAQQIPLSGILGRLQIAVGSDPKILGRLSARNDLTFTSASHVSL